MILTIINLAEVIAVITLVVGIIAAIAAIVVIHDVKLKYGLLISLGIVIIGSIIVLWKLPSESKLTDSNGTLSQKKPEDPNPAPNLEPPKPNNSSVIKGPQTPPTPKRQTSSSDDLKYRPQQEVGTYRTTRKNGAAVNIEAAVNVSVTFENEKLLYTGPGQPTYLLENIEGRRYKMLIPGYDGYFVTFRPVKGNESQTEMFLEYPQGNWVLSRIQ